MNFVTHDQMAGQRWHCAVTGRSSDPEGMFDCRVPLTFIGTDNKPVPTEYRTCVSAAAAKEMAREMGWHPPEKVAEIEAMLAEYGAKIASLQAYADKIEQREQLDRELAEAVA